MGRPAMRGHPLKKGMFIYILRSIKDGKHYIGISNNPEKRLTEYHNRGLVQSTRHRRPFVLIYKEEVEDPSLARKKEIALKRMKGGIQFKQIIDKFTANENEKRVWSNGRMHPSQG